MSEPLGSWPHRLCDAKKSVLQQTFIWSFGYTTVEMLTRNKPTMVGISAANDNYYILATRKMSVNLENSSEGCQKFVDSCLTD